MDTKFYFNDKSAPTPNAHPSIGCVAIIESDGKFLLEHRADSDRWAFIGGKLENFETFEECIIREVKEETGLNSSHVTLWNTFSDPSRIIEYPNGIVKRTITIVFKVLVENLSEKKCSIESRSLELFSLQELLSLNLAETHVPIRSALTRSSKN